MSILDFAVRAGGGAASAIGGAASKAAAPVTNLASNLFEAYKPSSLLMSLARSGLGPIPDMIADFGSSFTSSFGSSSVGKQEKFQEEQLGEEREQNGTLEAILEVLNESMTFLKGIQESLIDGLMLQRNEAIDEDRKAFSEIEAAREKLGPQEYPAPVEVKPKFGSNLGIGELLVSSLIGNSVGPMLATLGGFIIGSMTGTITKIIAGAAFIGKLTAGIIPALARIGPAIGALFSRILPASFAGAITVRGLIGVLGKLAWPLLILGTIGSALSAGIQEYMESGNIWDAIYAGLDESLKFLTFGLVDMEKLQQAWDLLMFKLGLNFDAMWADLSMKFEELMAGTGALIENAGAGLHDNIVAPIQNWVNDYIVTPLTNLFDSVKNTFTSIRDSLNNAFADMIIGWGNSIRDDWFLLPGNQQLGNQIADWGRQLKGEEALPVPSIPEPPAELRNDGETWFRNEAPTRTENDNWELPRRERVYSGPQSQANLDFILSNPLVTLDPNIPEPVLNRFIQQDVTPQNFSPANPNIFVTNDNRNQSTNVTGAPQSRAPMSVPINTRPLSTSSWETESRLLNGN